jgi:Family of unknown function (DUF6318)
MHRGLIAAAVAALCSPVLFACSSDNPQADPTTPPPTTPTVSVSDPPSTPPSTTPTKPTISLPPLAKRESVPGAKAFVRFYIGAINTSIDARSSALVRKYSTAECITCRGIASSMEKIRQDHGFYHGGDWIVTSVTPIPLQHLNSPIMHTAVTVTAGAWKRSPTDHLRTIEADKMYVDVHLSWTKTHWIVTSIVSAS